MRTFDLLEGLNVIMFGAVRDAQNFCDKFRIIAGPAAGRTSIMAFHERPPCRDEANPFFVVVCNNFYRRL